MPRTARDPRRGVRTLGQTLVDWALFRLAGRAGLCLAVVLAIPTLAASRRAGPLTLVSLLMLLALVVVLPRAAARRLTSSRSALDELHEQSRLQSEAVQHERRELSQWVADQVARDRLTGLLNRTAFLEQLTTVIGRSSTNECRAVLVVDLSGFSGFNEAYGPNISDEMLVAVAARLGSVLRPEDVVARLDGDVFGALLQTVPRELVQHVVARVHDAVAATYSVGGVHYTIGAACGVVSLDTQDGVTAADLLHRAEIALQNAKATARPVVAFEPRLEAQTRDRLQFYDDIASGLTGNQFTLAYQPIIRTATGEISGVEALMRWHHPRRGVVSPAEFVPMAEASGQIVDMGLMALQAACRQQREWRRTYDLDLVMSVNLSARQIRDPDDVERIAELITRETVDPRTVKLEITESLLVEDNAAAMDVLHRLRSLGVRLSIDDFGTGYASLSRLSKLPIHELKIDRYFVAGIGCEGPRETILAASIGMAHGLGLEVVAEGVETFEQLSYLQSHGCDSIQGFLYSKPLAAQRIVPFSRIRRTLNMPTQRLDEQAPPLPPIPAVLPSLERAQPRRFFAR